MKLYGVLLTAALCINYCFAVLSCIDDKSCPHANHECKNSECLCKTSYRPDNKNACFPVLGSNCESSDECTNFPGAVCENNKCTCTSGTIAGSLTCIAEKKLGQECVQHSECIRLGGDQAECKDKVCTCKPEFHSSADKKCIPNKGLNDACPKDDECYSLVGDENALKCENNLCICKEGYEDRDGKCNGGSSISVFPLTIVLSAIFVTLRF